MAALGGGDERPTRGLAWAPKGGNRKGKGAVKKSTRQGVDGEKAVKGGNNECQELGENGTRGNKLGL